MGQLRNILYGIEENPFKFVKVWRLVGIGCWGWTSSNISGAFGWGVDARLACSRHDFRYSWLVHCSLCILQQWDRISIDRNTSSWWKRLLCLPSWLQQSASSNWMYSVWKIFPGFCMHFCRGFLPGSLLTFEFAFLLLSSNFGESPLFWYSLFATPLYIFEIVVGIYLV